MALVDIKSETKQNYKKRKSDQNGGNFAKPELRIQVLTCSTFMQSQLVVTWSVTLTGLPRVEANHELHHYKEKYKKWRSFRKHGLHLITVWIIQTKNSKLSRLALENKTKEPQNLKGNNWKWTL